MILDYLLISYARLKLLSIILSLLNVVVYYYLLDTKHKCLNILLNSIFRMVLTKELIRDYLKLNKGCMIPYSPAEIAKALSDSVKSGDRCELEELLDVMLAVDDSLVGDCKIETLQNFAYVGAVADHLDDEVMALGTAAMAYANPAKHGPVMRAVLSVFQNRGINIKDLYGSEFFDPSLN